MDLLQFAQASNSAAAAVETIDPDAQAGSNASSGEEVQADESQDEEVFLDSSADHGDDLPGDGGATADRLSSAVRASSVQAPPHQIHERAGRSQFTGITLTALLSHKHSLCARAPLVLNGTQ